MAEPIQEQYRAMMNGLAEGIDEILNGKSKPKRIAFALLMAETGAIEGGRANYISNADRADITALLRETLARFEGRMVDEAGHA